MNKYQEILKQYWGYDSFRDLQEEIITSIGEGKDTLGLMPTGGGKSITFQVPALAQSGLCIVITPLIALMKDQVQNLRKRGIKALAIYSGMTRQEIVTALENCIFGDYKFLYISPERLDTEIFRIKLRSMKVSMITVDESHCISQWGYDFRPAYLKIAEIRELLPGVPVLALTATATPEVVKDIQSRLNFREENVFRMSFERKNLAYIVRKTDNKTGELLHILKRIDGSAIIYVRNRRRTKEITELLMQEGITADFYHAGLDNAVKDLRQKRWQNGEIRVMVATNAFGMGIDKSDVRFVVNCGLPLSLEEYYQEAGRAGRDGEPAECYLLWSRGDIRTCHFFIDNTEFPPETPQAERKMLLRNRERLLSAMIGYAMGESCLRARVLRYFGQDASSLGEGDGSSGCGGCSVCLGTSADEYLRATRPRRAFGALGAKGSYRTRELPSETEVTDEDERLFQRLRALRKQLADEYHVLPYMIFSDATLRAMVRRRPANVEELLEVPGVGRAKLQRYGDAFLEEVNR